MFEDSTFESEGRIHTRSRGWMIAALIFNAAIVLALILIPLVYPEGLPPQALGFLLTAPPPPLAQPELPRRPTRVLPGTHEMNGATLMAPPSIPRIMSVERDPEQRPGNRLMTMDSGLGAPDEVSAFVSRRAAAMVRQELSGPVRVSTGVMSGNLIYKVSPMYPPIARQAGVEGTVVLQATISQSGTIENLRVISGPPMLQQAALAAVRTWLYRPYLLSGQPVEVETTVNVVFKLGS